MLNTLNRMPNGLNLRPSSASDDAFIAKLHNSTRDDLRQIDADQEFIEELIDMQFQAQTNGYGDQFPNAMYFIIEKLGERVGRVTLDFGHNEIRIIDIAFIPVARGHGFGESILRALQQTAAQIMAPLTLSVQHTNPRALQLYLRLGFRVEEASDMYSRMSWYPDTEQIS